MSLYSGYHSKFGGLGFESRTVDTTEFDLFSSASPAKCWNETLRITRFLP